MQQAASSTQAADVVASKEESKTLHVQLSAAASSQSMDIATAEKVRCIGTISRHAYNFVQLWCWRYQLLIFVICNVLLP